MELQDGPAKAKEQRSPKALESIDIATSTDVLVDGVMAEDARPFAEAATRIEGDRTSAQRSLLLGKTLGCTGRTASPTVGDLPAATGNSPAVEEEQIFLTVVEEGRGAQKPVAPHEASEEFVAPSAALTAPRPEEPSCGRSLFAGLRNLSRAASPRAAARPDPQVDSSPAYGSLPDSSVSFNAPALSAALPPSSADALLKCEEEVQGESKLRPQPAVSSSPASSASMSLPSSALFEGDA